MIRDAGFVVERSDGAVAPWSDLGLDDTFRVEGTDRILKPEVFADLG
jgi:hypothetical protein